MNSYLLLLLRLYIAIHTTWDYLSIDFLLDKKQMTGAAAGTADDIDYPQTSQTFTYTVSSMHGWWYWLSADITNLYLHGVKHAQLMVWTIRRHHKPLLTRCQACTADDIDYPQTSQTLTYTLSSMHSRWYWLFADITNLNLHAVKHAQLMVLTVRRHHKP